MGLNGGLIAPGDYVNLAETDRQILRHMAGDSPGVNSDTDFKVDPATGMSVRISSGRAFVEGKNTFAQGYYLAWADSNTTVPIPPVGATPRVDRVVLVVRDEQYGALPAGTVNGAAFVVVPGTPNATPVAQTDSYVTSYVGPGGWLELARVAVDANATSIASNKITDKRLMCWSRTAQERVPAWSGVLSADFTIPHNWHRVPNFIDRHSVGGMTKIGRAVVIPRTGLYQVVAQGGISARTTGYKQIRILLDPTTNGETSNGALPGTGLLTHRNEAGAAQAQTLFAIRTAPLNAGQRVMMTMYQNSGVTLTGYGAPYHTHMDITWVGSL